MAERTVTTEIRATENGDYQIIRTNNKDGSQKDAVTFHSVEALDEKNIAKNLMELSRKDGTYRAAFQSLLGVILGSTRLNGFKGTGDKATGKTSKEFKAAVRDAESDVIMEMVKHGSIKLDKSKNVEIAFQEFMSSLRDNKNYSNIKTYCSSYFAIVGHNCVTPSGRLVPQPVMVAETQTAIHRAPADNSLAAQIEGVMSKLNAIKALSAADAQKALGSAKMLYATLEGIVNDYAAKATEAHANGTNVASQAKQAIASAGATKAPSEHAKATQRAAMAKAEPALV